MVEEYAEEMRKFNPKLFVLGGLQMMDNFPFAPGEWSAETARFLLRELLCF